MSIKSFTNAELTWDPPVIDRSVFEKQVGVYLKNNEDTGFLDYAGQDTKMSCKYIIENISKYNIEYAGIIKGGKKLIYIHMIRSDINYSDGKSFTIIMDGGCSAVTIMYNPFTNEVLSLFCNGVA
jgi:hypothetical protein